MPAGHLAVVEALIYGGCFVDAPNGGGLTALAAATLNYRASIVNVLLRNGAIPVTGSKH